MEKFKELGVDMYIISADPYTNQKELFDAIHERYGYSLPFLSDPEFKLIDKMGMKNGDMANRGYGLVDGEGQVVFSTTNDHWGEQFETTFEEIQKELKDIK